MMKMNAIRAAILIGTFTLVISLMSLELPIGNAQESASQQKPAPQMSYEEAVIRWTYLKVMYYNSIANQEKARSDRMLYNPQDDIKLEISNVHTGPVSDIQDRTYESLKTFPSGQIIILGRGSKTMNENPFPQVWYTAEWEPEQHAPVVGPRAMLFKDVLRTLGADYADVGKYSTYDVVVSLDGKQRTYKALALFHNAYNSVEDARPEFWDSVIGMGGTLADIWNETRPPLGAVRKPVAEGGKNNPSQPNTKETEYKRRIKPFGCDSSQPICCPWGASTLDQCKWNDDYPWSEPFGPTRLYGKKQSIVRDKDDGTFYGTPNNGVNAVTNLTSSCNYFWRRYNTQLMYSSDSRDHDSGNHYALTEIYFECERTTTCYSTCNPKISQGGAGDDKAGVHYRWGLVQPYHVYRKDNSQVGTGGNNNPASLTCKGGMAYAFKTCPSPDCTFNVTFSWLGASLQSSGGDLWNVTGHSREHTCSFTGDVSGGTGGLGQCGPGTGSYCFYSSNGASCGAGTFAFPPCCCYWSPIVIDISRYWDSALNSGTGYQFTDVAGGVRFDLDGNGVKEQVAWPTATSENAWLVLDRNNNGVIDSGKELFGNFTDQTGPYGEPVAPGQGNGWQALAAFDRRDYLGGNQDQIINRADLVFEKLRLWVDRNHNGISEPNELITLESIGITRIDYSYQDALWTDAFGNSFRFKGTFYWGDLGEEPYLEWHKDAWDVFPQWAL